MIRNMKGKTNLIETNLMILLISIYYYFVPDQKASCDLVETSRSGIVPLLLVELITYYIWRDILQGECILSQQKIVKKIDYI